MKVFLDIMDFLNPKNVSVMKMDQWLRLVMMAVANALANQM